jgi:hypothetical protein
VVFFAQGSSAGGTPVRNAVHLLVRSATRAVRVATALTVVPVGLLVVGTGTASAAGTDTTVRADSTTITFGALGPVGVIAIALGIVGMAAGVFRQRRRARAGAVVADTSTLATPVEPDVLGMVEAVLTDEPIRSATPIPRP